MKILSKVFDSIRLSVIFEVLSKKPNVLAAAKVVRLIHIAKTINKIAMSELDKKAAYIADLAKIAKFLPTRFVKKVRDKLPEKSIARIKNARSGVVRDEEVLAVLKIISEDERQRRQQAALKVLEETGVGV
jgi:hypothetical protein